MVHEYFVDYGVSIRICRKGTQNMEQEILQRDKEKKVEYRYYEMPVNSYVLPLLGERWTTNYGRDSLHFHNYLEIGYCYYGKGKIVTEEQSYEYENDTYTVIPKNYIHRTQSNPERIEKWEYLFIDMDRFLAAFYQNEHTAIADLMKEAIDKNVQVCTAGENPETAEVIRCTLEEARSRKKFYKESIKGCLQTLLVMIARNAASDAKETVEDEKGKKENRLGVVLEYISTHYPEQIRISDLADMCHVSETHLRRLFQEVMNISPLEYMNLVRVQAACHELHRTDKPVDKIRTEVGFETASTFNRNFKKLVGMSPNEWRMKKKDKADYNISIYKGW